MTVKNILVLCGSPRKGGNSESLADALIKGAEKTGHKVKKINICDLDIKGCLACKGCWNSAGNCIYNDDMKLVENNLETADILVCATPLYWSVVPAQMKAVIDRIYQYDPVHGSKKMSIKESVLLTCGETENEEDFQMVKDFYSFFAEWNGIKMREIITVTQMHDVGDIINNEALKKAELLGGSL